MVWEAVCKSRPASHSCASHPHEEQHDRPGGAKETKIVGGGRFETRPSRCNCTHLSNPSRSACLSASLLGVGGERRMGSLNLLTCGGGRGQSGRAGSPPVSQRFSIFGMQRAAWEGESILRCNIRQAVRLEAADQGLQVCQPASQERCHPNRAVLPVFPAPALRRHPHASDPPAPPSYSLVLPHERGGLRVVKKGGNGRPSYTHFTQPIRGARGESGHAMLLGSDELPCRIERNEEG